MSAPIGIVGAGPVAQALGRLLCERRQPVVALTSRTPAHAQRAAQFIGHGVKAVSYAELARHSKRVLIATSDAGIRPAAEALFKAGYAKGIALHTCGAEGTAALAVLQSVGVDCGVFHPLQTIAAADQGTRDLTGISFAVTGDQRAVEWAREVAHLLEGSVMAIAEERLPLYHSGAVMASNAVVAVVEAAVELMERAGVDQKRALAALEPLCRTTVDNLFRTSPAAALTGPIMRGDVQTVRRHRAAFVGVSAETVSLYRSVGIALLRLARDRGVPEETLQALAAALAEKPAEVS